MQNDPQFWFPAKRYGWGWGFPITWQGWVVLVAFVALIVAGVLLFPPTKEPLRFVAYIAVLCVLLIAVGWLKGEPPRWHWGRH
jgi:hypothetical protein